MKHQTTFSAEVFVLHNIEDIFYLNFGEIQLILCAVFFVSSWFKINIALMSVCDVAKE